MLFSIAPMAVAFDMPFDMPFEAALPGWTGEEFAEVYPAPFTIPLGPPPMYTFGTVTGGPGHMVVTPPGAPHGGHAGPEGGVQQLGSPRLSPAPPPAPPSEPKTDAENH